MNQQAHIVKMIRELEPFFDAVHNVYVRFRRPNVDERAELEDQIPTIVRGVEESVTAHLSEDASKLASPVKVPRAEIQALTRHLNKLLIGARVPGESGRYSADEREAILPDDYLLMVGPTTLLLMYSHLLTQQLLSDAGTSLVELTSGNRTGNS